MTQSDELKHAAAGYLQALDRNPNDFAALYSLGVMRAMQGKTAEARALLERALAQEPNQPDALAALGNLLNEAGESERALDSYNRALAVEPDHAGALINKGALFHARHQYDQAVALYDQVLTAEPGNVPCLINRALALHELGRFSEAIATLDYACMLAPSDPDVLLARGNAQQAAQNYTAAQADYRQVLALRWSDPEARVGLANTLAAQGEHDGALRLLGEVLRASPGHRDAHFYRGNILRDQKKLAEAVAAYDQALSWAPDFVRAQRNKGFCLLLQADFERGLPLYECRKRLPVPIEARQYDVPLWTGSENLSGKTLFLYIEQGLGDTLQFFRFLKPLEEIGANIVLSCQDQLSRLLRDAGTKCEIIPSRAIPAKFDYHCPLPSLPLALKLRENTIPAAIPYLRAEPQLAAKWAARIGTSGFRIGIAWQGELNMDAARSFPVALLADIGRLAGVRLISLQKGPGIEQLAALPDGMAVEILDPFDEGEQAFLDTAAVMASLDLVVTPDTSIAHLAGALGRPACVMLKEVPDWRWMLDRTDSPWYPDLRLFRQPRFGDWRGAFAALHDHVVARMGLA